MTLFDESNFIVHLDEETTVSQIGITRNRIVEIPNFISPENSSKVIEFLEAQAELWGDIAFYGSRGMGIDHNSPLVEEVGLPRGFFDELKGNFQKGVESVFKRAVKANSAHSQKWLPGGFASPHSDNSDFKGTPTSFEINKYVGILYLNDNYEGGDLYFVETEDVHTEKLRISPKAGSFITFPGGIENIHGVSEILSGERYTMVSFWDFADATYSEERQKEWAMEKEIVELSKALAKQEWERGNKWA
jgi:hypothetical protein